MVRVNDKCFIDVTNKNYTLVNITKNKKTGKKEKEILGYFGSLECLFDALLKQFILDKMPKDKIIELKEFKDIIVSAKQEVREKLAAIINEK